MPGRRKLPFMTYHAGRLVFDSFDGFLASDPERRIKEGRVGYRIRPDVKATPRTSLLPGYWVRVNGDGHSTRPK